MKKIIFSFLLLFPLWGAGGLFAAAPTTSAINVDYAAKKVTFSVSWTKRPTADKIWLWVDYRKVQNNVETGSWTRAAVTAATKTTGTGTAATVTGNNKGFWLQSVTSTSGSATVTVTFNLPSDVTKFLWCSYASDAPPHLDFTSLHEYQLHGTPPFRLTSNIGDIVINDKNIYTNSPVKIFSTLIDLTECPGVINCTPSTPMTELCRGSAPALTILNSINDDITN
jgi:hypothetical protein